jgi:hypothetical protein
MKKNPFSAGIVLILIALLGLHLSTSIAASTRIQDPLDQNRFFDYGDFPEELAREVKGKALHDLLVAWPDLDSESRESIKNYFECIGTLSDKQKELQSVQDEKGKVDSEYEKARRELKRLLLAAFGRLGLQTFITMIDAWTDVQRLTRKGAESDKVSEGDLDDGTQKLDPKTKKTLEQLDMRMKRINEAQQKAKLQKEKVANLERRIVKELPTKLTTADGHQIKIAKDGKVWICSDPCEEFSKKYGSILAKNEDLAAELERIKKLPDDEKAQEIASLKLRADKAEERMAKLEELKKQRADKLRKDQLKEGIQKAEAKGKLDDLDPADRLWLEADLRRKELAYDPDTKSFKVKEAKAALKAEQDGVLDPPVTRGIDERGNSQGADYLDGKGKPWDVKDASASADQIVDVAAPKGGKPGENVLVDCSGLTPAQQKALENEIKNNLKPGSGEVRFVPKS